MKATNYTVLTASHALRRIANVLYVVEALTARKRTAGREQVVADLDDLGDWDSQTVDTCRDLGIDVWHISDVAQDYVKNLVSAWTEHGIHGAERAELNN